jgi:pyruvate/2-oxoglutarate dehydrogenase complex dihydrolipoamide dehydrogenase (E3) component
VEVSGSHLLLAHGPETEHWRPRPGQGGVECDSRGCIKVDNQLRTNVVGIWALGECNGRGGFTHTSYNDLQLVAANLLDHETRSIADRIRAYSLYIDPALGRCGMTEREALPPDSVS